MNNLISFMVFVVISVARASDKMTDKTSVISKAFKTPKKAQITDAELRRFALSLATGNRSFIWPDELERSALELVDSDSDGCTEVFGNEFSKLVNYEVDLIKKARHLNVHWK
jgi:hypothetical protein